MAGVGFDDGRRSGFGRAEATDKYHQGQYERPDEWPDYGSCLPTR